MIHRLRFWISRPRGSAIARSLRTWGPSGRFALILAATSLFLAGCAVIPAAPALGWSVLVFAAALLLGGCIDTDIGEKPGITIDDVTVEEGQTAVFTITRGGDLGTPLEFYTETIFGGYSDSAIPGSDCSDSNTDFIGYQGTYTFSSYVADLYLSIPTCVNSSGDYLGDEFFEVDISWQAGDSSGYTFEERVVTGTGIITESYGDGYYSGGTYLSIDDASAYEGSTLVFDVSRSGDTSTYVTVDFTTVPYNGITSCLFSYVDFIEDRGTLYFSAFDTTESIYISTCVNSLYEYASETFEVYLYNASGATILDDTGVGTIFE
jgi:hypothetical protein